MSMGVVSREVLPACERLCFICPSLRTRSRHPVKRYKKLLAEIFPRTQDEGPNDRKIGKLCEYISRNPMRVPKITVYLEQKCYKEMRAERYGSVKVVMAIYRKVDSTYMFNLENQIPKLCHLAQEMGEKEKICILQAAGLQALSSMIWFMGEHSHISAELDNVVSAVLENYESPYAKSDNDDAPLEDRRIRWVNDVLRSEGHEPPAVTILTRVPSWKDIRAAHGELSLTIYLRHCMPGQNAHILLSMLVKHLEHKNVLKQPDMILDIIEVTARLAEHSKAQSSTALMAAISDMVRHMGKSMQSLANDAGPGDNMVKWSNGHGKAVDECLVQLSRKVGDAGPILDTLAVVLENISSSTIVARSIISAAYRTAQIVASLPNLTHQSKDAVTLMLSVRQANLLLSSLWTQALSPENVPRNYEAISHTYSLMLLFSGDKGSGIEVLVGSFQLAFSLRIVSLQAGFLPPSRRRSLFTLATSMLVFFSKASNIPSLIPVVKHVLTESTVDPFLRLVEDCRLQALDRAAEPCYGSKEDDDLALKSLSNIDMNEDQSKETSVSLILNSLEDLSESELSTIRKQLLEEFSADDICPLGETPSKSPTQNGKLPQKSMEVIPLGFVFEDDTLVEPSDSLAEPRLRHQQDSGLLDVNQLLDSVSETSRHVGRLSGSTNNDLPFKDVANQCEALLIGKQQKLYVCMSVCQKEDGESSTEKIESSPEDPESDGFLCAADGQCDSNFCKLPVLSPYDRFLAGSGC
ncbi:hypothetical protein BAE44_0015167 [Dichanthelium oligosanthes]|uniref:ARM repeat superfamily protein n=1 Tax=Dichanthelium oligosanthes TaxID=888268 RepID=A0A1E5VFA8_9POAL|nr:hypothetical protein BAE44_0015167 [Dichanthelium oligosanthes]